MGVSAKTRAKRTLEKRSDSYLFRIEQVIPSYSFGTNEGRLSVGLYSEYHHTEIESVCLSPKRFDGRPTRFTLLATRQITRDLEALYAGEQTRFGVGTLTFRGSQSSYLGSIPFDAAVPIPGLILAGAYQFIYLSGDAMSHGTASIRYLAMHHSYDPDDL
ncbi:MULTISPECIES: hypothetical protein [unclassified Sphingomonas]|uniref:hypothetical protein n=1 Tax=unclassified Sphingomonas TaxID=196159 RepID=UPI00267B7800